MNSEKLVIFDLDQTLIYDIDSVMVLCIICDKYHDACEIDKKEIEGSIHWIEADFQKAILTKGLCIDALKKEFLKTIKPIKNIKETVDKLHEQRMKCILITAGPIQVAKIASEIWDIDYSYGSLYEEKDGFFTGCILKHLGIEGKLSYLKAFCKKYGYEPKQCIAVGDGDTDIPIFNYCGDSIGLNCSDEMIGKAKHHIWTEDLFDILEYII